MGCSVSGLFLILSPIHSLPTHKVTQTENKTKIWRGEQSSPYLLGLKTSYWFSKSGRKSFCSWVFMALHLSIHLSAHPFIDPPIHHPSINPSNHPLIDPPTHPSSIYHPSFHLSIPWTVHPTSIHLSINLFIHHPTIHPLIYATNHSLSLVSGQALH